MNLEQIQSLTIEDVKELLLERLSMEEPTQEELEAELESYKAELIAELERVQDLKDRYSALSDKGIIQGSLNISNPDAYFRDEVLKNSDKDQAELKLSEMEQAYQVRVQALHSVKWIDNRQSEYAKIDKLLLEAIAEKEAGRPDKMAEYLALREQIRLDNPKSE